MRPTTAAALRSPRDLTIVKGLLYITEPGYDAHRIRTVNWPRASSPQSQGRRTAAIFPTVNNGVAAVMYCFFFLYLMFAGPGAWSVDAMVTRSRRREGSHDSGTRPTGEPNNNSGE